MAFLRRPTWSPVTRVVILVLLFGVMSGCSYGRSEPGLFRSLPLSPVSAKLGDAPPASGAGTALPVAGESVWTFGIGPHVNIRIAVHAVRRVAGGTILDWSLTPLSVLGLANGSPLRGDVQLGLTRREDGSTNAFLVDPVNQVRYRPLATATGGCVCTPLDEIVKHLRTGQTTLLQTGFPRVPADLDAVDVDIPTVPMFSSIPISSLGEVPQAEFPTDLTRPPISNAVGIWSPMFAAPSSQQKFQIVLDTVWVSDSFTSISWRVRAVTAGPGLRSVDQQPFAEKDDGRRSSNAASASGPTVAIDLADRRVLRSRLVRIGSVGDSLEECLCTDLRPWATLLREPGDEVAVVTNLQPLTKIGAFAVDAQFPGLVTMHHVGISAVSVGSARLTRSRLVSPTFWSVAGPPPGFAASQWPPPVPPANILSAARASLDPIAR